jgi:hypothetical protein
VVDHFSDAVVKNPIVGPKSKNPQLREWHTKNLGRLPGLKFMRTRLWGFGLRGRRSVGAVKTGVGLIVEASHGRRVGLRRDFQRMVG